jgi:hypothetical protein
MRRVDFSEDYKGKKETDPKKLNFIEKYIDEVISGEFIDLIYQIKEFMDYLKSQKYNLSEHYLRYVMTYLNLCKFFSNIKDKIIVELGGLSPITAYLSKFNGCFISTDADFRLNIDIPENFADIVFSFEVIEHLKDVPEKSFDEVVLFNFTGVKKYVHHMFKILKEEGYVVLTTPNPCSSKSILNILNFKHPYIFPYHVREYTKEEILKLFQEKFSLEYYTTMEVFFPYSSKKLINFIQNYVFSSEDRGDDQFFIFRKR